MKWLNGKIVVGYRVASGRQEGCRFPGGTIQLQQPFFKEKGIDLSSYFFGTLNVDLSPFEPTPDHGFFDGMIEWLPGVQERFVLSRIEIKAKSSVCPGLWYYPHPQTKQDHFQRESVVELLLPWIDGLAIGEVVAVRL